MGGQSVNQVDCPFLTSILFSSAWSGRQLVICYILKVVEEQVQIPSCTTSLCTWKLSPRVKWPLTFLHCFYSGLLEGCWNSKCYPVGSWVWEGLPGCGRKGMIILEPSLCWSRDLLCTLQLYFNIYLYSFAPQLLKHC